MVLFSILNNLSLFGQSLPNIQSEPLVNTLNFVITDSVFVSTNGDDANPGTESQPVATFSRAIQLLPFGQVGVNGGHAYGLVVIKPGRYNQVFVQSNSQWKNGNTFKNISVRGKGEVIIGGSVNTPANNHLMALRGSHIFVENIKMRNGNIIGLLISGEPTEPRETTDIIIRNVEIDSVNSHGVLIRYCERVLADNVSVKHSNVYSPPVPPNPCDSWPSGFKPYMSRHVTIKNSIVTRNWGEGINFHNCEYGLIDNCFSGDNYGTNVYSDNSSKLVIRNSIIYNTPGMKDLWRSCFGYENAPLAAAGISLTNERSCPGDYVLNNQMNCQIECVNPILDNLIVPHNDSIFAYNNILLNCGSAFSIWEGYVGIGSGTSCYSNVWAVHNTCIGFDSDSAMSNKGFLSFNFGTGIAFPNNPTPMSSMINSTFAQNVFSYSQSKNPGVNPVRRRLDANFPVPFDVDFYGNYWNIQPPAFAFDSTSTVEPGLPVDGHYGAITQWQQQINPFLVDGVPIAFVTDDFYGNQRVKWYAGAVENMALSAMWHDQINAKKPILIPNPARDKVYISIPDACASCLLTIRMTDMRGATVREEKTHTPIISLEGLSPGTYHVHAEMGGRVYRSKLIKI